MFCDPNTWSYFGIVGGLKDMGHIQVKELWYSLGGGFVLEDRLKLLIDDDKGVMHMVNIARLNGVVHLYVVHKMSKPEITDMIEGVQLKVDGQLGLKDIKRVLSFSMVVKVRSC